MRIEPPPSAASATLASPAATETAAPPLEPPSVRVVSHGLAASGPRRLSLVADWPNSAVLVLPVNTAPAALSRRTTPLSSCVTVVAVYGRAEGCHRACKRVGVLDRDRHAAQRQRPADPVSGFGLARLPPGEVIEAGEIGVERPDSVGRFSRAPRSPLRPATIRPCR